MILGHIAMRGTAMELPSGWARVLWGAAALVVCSALYGYRRVLAGLADRDGTSTSAAFGGQGAVAGVLAVVAWILGSVWVVTGAADYGGAWAVAGAAAVGVCTGGAIAGARLVRRRARSKDCPPS